MTEDVRALDIQDVVIEYKRKREVIQAVAGVSLSVDSGEVVGLVGESGCGKSTLAKGAVGLLRPAEGQILFHGEAVIPLKRGGRPTNQRNLQMIFQDPQSSLNPRRTVGSQIVDGIRLASDVPRDRETKRVGELLEQVGLSPDAGSSYPHQFSGGQRQRICIARALAAQPTVLVADEPISALDASAQAQIANLLIELTKKLGIALLFISHDLSIVREIADRVAVMYLGKIVEAGKPNDLWNRPLHPYTRALINAVPTVDKAELPAALAGEVPDPAAPPPGCRFHTRCPHAFDQCWQQEPELLEILDQNYAACWLNEPGRPGKELVDPESLVGQSEGHPNGSTQSEPAATRDHHGTS